MQSFGSSATDVTSDLTKLSPLCVDLDGTLVRNDTMIEAGAMLCLTKPWLLFAMIFWFMRGRSYLKEQIAKRWSFNPTILAYNQELIGMLRVAKSKGAYLVLATGSHEIVAKKIAEHLDIFDEVLATSAGCNLVGQAKANQLTQKFGAKEFCYIGNSTADLHVWAAARSAIVVNYSKSLLRRTQKLTDVLTTYPRQHSPVRAVATLMRPHQWLKNILLFIPVLGWGGIHHSDMLITTFMAFLSFSLTASGVYVINDFVDLHSDRLHKSKRNRPLAAGDLELSTAPILGFLLTCTGFLLGSLVTDQFLVVLTLYWIITVAYSFGLKRFAIVDVITLAILYMVRIYAGAAATDITISAWLLGFSVFFFLSLALVKRVSELKPLFQLNSKIVPGRGYQPGDFPMLISFGSSSGYLSILIFALYINLSEQAAAYPRPEYLWLVCLTLLYWISHVWLITARGDMSSDPILFAMKDRPSQMAGVLTIALLALAAVRTL